MAAPLWARLDVERLAFALRDELPLGAACYPESAWRSAAENTPAPHSFDGYNDAENWSFLLDDEEEEDEHDDLVQSFTEWVQQTRPQVKRWLLQPAKMHIAAMALDRLELPIWGNSQQLSQSLGISLDDLQWLGKPSWQMAPRDQHHKGMAASHYRHRLIPKARGGLRLLEVPKLQLAQVQQHLLAQLLNNVPVHEAAHGFVAGRSVHTHAALHAGQAVVCAFDLRDFFHSIGAAQIRALWRTLGYPSGTANQLTALTTTVTPRPVWERLLEESSITRHQAKRLASPHLAQGASTSPSIANLCAFRLDLRLSALAERFGAIYSRYADDLVFSGPTQLRKDFAVLRGWVTAIAADEGFALHPDKTRRMPSHKRQRITGLVVNDGPNLPREEYDLLRAELHRLSLQDSVSHAQFAAVQGRVAWACQAVTPARQSKLRALLARIPKATEAQKDSHGFL